MADLILLIGIFWGVLGFCFNFFAVPESGIQDKYFYLVTFLSGPLVWLIYLAIFLYMLYVVHVSDY